MTLVEVMAALAILAVAGGSCLAFTSTALRSLHRARVAEQEMSGANELLSAVSLWPRADLDRRLGQRRQGPWWLVIQRETDRLYSVSVRDTTSGSVVLATYLHREVP